MTARPPPAEHPLGFRFIGVADGVESELLFVQRGPLKGWVCRWHRRGYWIKLRMADCEDRRKISYRIALGN